MDSRDASAPQVSETTSFADVVLRRFGATKEASAGGEDAEGARARFVAAYGPMVVSRFCTSVAAGVALTDGRSSANFGRQDGLRTELMKRLSHRSEQRRRRWEEHRSAVLHFVFPPITATNARAVELLSRCKEQSVLARRFLGDVDLRNCLELFYWPADALMALVDVASTADPAPVPMTAATEPAQGAGKGNPTEGDAQAGRDPYQVVEAELDSANRYYQYFTQRVVRLQYFTGIAYGVVIAVIVPLLLLLLRGRGLLTAIPVALTWSVLGGALGAVTSVLSRATFGRIILDRAQGGTWNTMLGVFRPVIGALFGAAFFGLINSGILPVQVPVADRQTVFYASIAFLAGFSHRWAQDSIKAAEGRIIVPSGQKPTDQAGAVKSQGLAGEDSSDSVS